LFFILIRLFKDIFLWLFVFVIFAFSFQLGFINITAQAGFDPTEGYPNGSFPVSFFTIIGDFTYIEPQLEQAPLGIALLAIYALIAQIMLVNLLIAMMGSTYSNVSDNSLEEWKFFRLELVVENRATSFHPPPTNLVVLPISAIVGYRQAIKEFKDWWNSTDEEPLIVRIGSASNVLTPAEEITMDKILKKMRNARDEVVEEEDEEDETSVGSIVTSLRERLRTLAKERENDRTFLEKKFKDIEGNMRTRQEGRGEGGGAHGGKSLRERVDDMQALQRVMDEKMEKSQKKLEEKLEQTQRGIEEQNKEILSLLRQLRGSS